MANSDPNSDLAMNLDCPFSPLLTEYASSSAESYVERALIVDEREESADEREKARNKRFMDRQELTRIILDTSLIRLDKRPLPAKMSVAISAGNLPLLEALIELHVERMLVDAKAYIVNGLCNRVIAGNVQAESACLLQQILASRSRVEFTVLPVEPDDLISGQ